MAVLAFVKENSVWVYPLLPFVIVVSNWTARAIGEPWFWRVINAILDGFQKDVFAALPEERTDDHRVTLYKWSRFCCWPGNRWHFWWPWGKGNWPGSGWLKPIVRSGVYKRGRTVFLAKTRKPEYAEGVVGNTYFSQQGVVEVNELPDIQQAQLASGDAHFCDYSAKTFVLLEWMTRRLRTGAPMARSFYAIRVEVNKARWGVVMIDSRAARIPSPQKTIHKFQFMQKTLGTLLERA